jgi:hypothetical protein
MANNSLMFDTPEDDDPLVSHELGGVNREGFASKQHQKTGRLLDDSQAGDTQEDQELPKKRKSAEDLLTPTRRSKRIANYDGSQDIKEAAKQEDEEGKRAKDPHSLHQNSARPVKRTIADYNRAMDKVREIENDEFASSSELIQARQMRKKVEEARARGEYGKMDDTAGGQQASQHVTEGPSNVQSAPHQERATAHSQQAAAAAGESMQEELAGPMREKIAGRMQRDARNARPQDHASGECT